MILVVGGAGYIGSHMVRVLRESNEEVVVFDNFEHGHREAVGDCPVETGDIRSVSDLETLFRRISEIDTVLHFGAYISVGESVREPNKYYGNNFVGAKNLLDTMCAAGVKQFIFSSTAAIFGEPQTPLIDETHPAIPLNPYGHSKLMVERLLLDYDRAYGLRSVCLRYFNAAGADPSGEIGEDHSPEEHLIPNAIFAAMGKKAGLTVFGDDYPTPDGTCVRDYIHVLDLCQAHILALHHLRRGGESRQYNLGNGQGYSVRQVIDAVSRATGKQVPYTMGPRRPGDSPTLVASSDRIKQDWGWSPQRPELQTMIEDAWRWHSQHPEGYGDRPRSTPE